MLLSSRKTKYLKPHTRKDNTETLPKLESSEFGCLALYSNQAGKLSKKQLETIRFLLRKLLKRQSKV